MNPLTAFAQRRRLPDFAHWLAAWWDAEPWHLRAPDPYYRCFMGGPVDLRCRRPSVDGWWCKKHGPRCEFEWRGLGRLRCTNPLGHRGRHRLRRWGSDTRAGTPVWAVAG